MTSRTVLETSILLVMTSIAVMATSIAALHGDAYCGTVRRLAALATSITALWDVDYSIGDVNCSQVLLQ
jgi:hypothetical protein